MYTVARDITRDLEDFDLRICPCSAVAAAGLVRSGKIPPMRLRTTRKVVV